VITAPPLILVNYGVVQCLEILSAFWGGTLRIGLFQNNLNLQHGTIAANIVPCNFSGYGGLLNIAGWLPPTLLNDVGTMLGLFVQWTHDGGPVANDVYGYYVVDVLGELVWAERNVDPVPVENLGDIYAVVPQFSLSSKY
jgi:hypothetical protein